MKQEMIEKERQVHDTQDVQDMTGEIHNKTEVAGAPSPILRVAEKRDLHQLACIEQECFQTPWSEEALRHDIEENDMARYLVAEQEGTLLGYLSLWKIGDEGHINNVAVLPEHRRKHVGIMLLDAMLASSEQEGVQSHTLEVRADNAPAMRLYEKRGFVPAGRRKGYYQEDGMDAIIMWRHADQQELK